MIDYESISVDCAIRDLLKQLKNNSLSVFCGAGATKQATSLEWKDLFSEKTREYSKINDDMYMLASIEKKYHNKNDFYNNITQKLKQVRHLPCNTIENLLRLELNQIWTTNFDEIIEDTIKRKYKITPEVIKNSQDLLTCNFFKKYIIYKLNGTCRDRTSMILTKEDYYKYFKNQRLMFETLKRQLVTDSFLFIGYSFKDELVLNALREIKEVLPNRGQIHYRFVKFENTNENISQEDYEEYMYYEIKYFYDMYNIKTIIINDYNEINSFLDKLYTAFCEQNVFISGSFRSITREERGFLENLVSELVKILYTNKFNIYSGNGRGMGEIVVAQTDKHSIKFPNGKFVNRPFIFLGDSTRTKGIANAKIMKDCSIMIIISGQDDNGNSKNVIKQFKQFIKQRENTPHIIIPLPQSGFAAKQIFNSSTFKNTLSYKMNIAAFSALAQASTPEEIAKITANIILSKFKPI